MTKRSQMFRLTAVAAAAVLGTFILWAQTPPTRSAPPSRNTVKVDEKPAAEQVPPKAVVADKEFDAGTVNKGDEIKHDFIVENQGKGVLEITRVQPACGCTVTEFDKKIEPGKSGKITATVHTTNFNGPIHKTISVATNDPEMSNFQLAIKATVKAVLNVTPNQFQQVGLVFKGQSLKKDFTLTSEDGTPFEVTQIQSEDPALKYDLKMAPDKKSATFTVILPEDHPTGPITGRFTLSTTHPKAPSVTLAVFGTIREPLTVYPQELIYSGLNKSWVDEHPDDVSLNKAITVAYEMAPELKIESVSSDLPFLEITHEPITPNQRYTIKVHIKPPVKAGDFSGKITIVTNKKTVEIPVRGKIF